MTKIKKFLSRISLSNYSIERRLPILIFTLLFFILTLFAVYAYVAVKKSAINAGVNRVNALSEQFASIFSIQARTLETFTSAVTNSNEVVNFLSNQNSKTKKVIEDFQDLKFSSDSLTQTVQLWDTNQNLLYNTNPLFNFHKNIKADLNSVLKIPGKTFVGVFREKGDSVLFPIVAAVVQDEITLGYVVRWRRVFASKKGMEQLAVLLGRDASLKIGNRDYSIWTNFVTIVPNPLKDAAQEDKILTFVNQKGNETIAAVKLIPGTAWVCLVDISKELVLQSSHKFLTWMITFGIALLFIGFLITRALSRNISRPLKKLTLSVAEISQGNYNATIDIHSSDELGTLANAFNDMVSTIKAAQENLEEKYREIRQKNNLLQSSLQEKVLLIKEVHHRVKNNLQIISSLLKLQANNLSDSQSIDAFNESQQRIRSMALIHEKLYKNGNFVKLNLEEYVKDLLNSLFITYKLSTYRVSRNIEIGNIPVDVDIAITLGLLINEIVTNSIKYALSNADEGIISIKLKSYEKNCYSLLIKDNGKGFPAEINIDESESLGIMLIKTLTEQLQGTIKFNSNNGAEVIIDFPIPENLIMEEV